MHFSLQSALGLSALLAAPADAFFRMPCGQNIVTERIDPIVDPGVVAGHVHQVNGGNGFGFTETYADARKATCTSCTAKADLSNYWTPTLYYQDQKTGQFTAVPQNGMTVYYLQRGTDTNIKAFPEGFRMLAGNPFKRNETQDFAGQAVSYVCLDYTGPPHPQPMGFPTQACPDGLRAQVFFPSCWDGVNLDSPDHKSHMSYPETGSYNGGTCPSSHPVQLISIFFEVIFDTSSFAWWDGNYGTQQPFVFSMGDPTGYGFHGDFIMGWDVDILQSAVDTCTNLSGTMEDCHVLELNTGDEMAACTIPSSIDEDIVGPMSKLPGCNPVTAGPQTATPDTNCPVTPISGPQIPFTDMSSQGWAYVGCATDVGSDRTLTGTNNIYSSDQSSTDVESCIKTCTGSQYAGLEYGKQCFCGNSVAADRMPSSSSLGSCNMPCAGNSSQVCGGGAQLSLYKACAAGSSCTNAVYQSIGNLGGGSGSSSPSTGSGGTGSTSGSSSSAPAAAGSSSSAAATSAAATSAAAASNAGGNGGSGGNAYTSAAAGTIGAAAVSSSAAAAQPTALTASAAVGNTPATTLLSSYKANVVYVTDTEVVYVTEDVTVTAAPTKKAKRFW